MLSKQITSSYMPLAAILATDQIYQAIADGSDEVGTLGHGFTASGHPVATAVALENLKIIEERGLVANAAAMGQVLQDGLRAFKDHPLVGEVRGVGLIGAVELVADKASKRPFEPEGRLGGYIYDQAHEHGLIVRSIRDTVAFCPPLIICEDEIGAMLTRFSATLDDAMAWVETGMVS